MINGGIDMDVKSEEHPHRFWVRFAPATLVASSALIWLISQHLGWRTGTLKGALALLALAMVLVMAFSYRTVVGLVAALASGALVVLLGFAGVDAAQHDVLARDGERTVAEVIAVDPGKGRGTPTCELRAADGRDISGRIHSNDYRVGDHVSVTFDPAGRVDPVEGAPDPDGEARWAAGLGGGLALLVLSLPLWGRLGPRLERDRDAAED
ncbi:DUF3592 domain-containing protein [Kitasatospora sp. NPDC004614]|uniref:DUF3592 domain-containing protein n=2 Tax=unclassified Kitasatospora TaxID=2633591 RepID=UPI0036A5A628